MKNVFVAGDENVLEPMATTIYSLAMHVQPGEYAVTAVVTGDDAVVARARSLCDDVHRLTGLATSVMPVLPTFTSCRPVVTHITSPTFTRMEIDRYLPKDVQKVLYVDTDAIFTGSPDELFELNLDNYFAAAVHDRWTATDVPVFNAGVMMLNLERWRAENVTEQVLTHDLFSTKISDQTILNIIFKDRWLEVNGVFNFVPGPAWKVDLPDFVRLYLHGRRDVRIMHFAGPNKPWLLRSNVNGYFIYKMYKNRNVDLAAQSTLLNLYTRWTEGA